jgi:hypothetical protein
MNRRKPHEILQRERVEKIRLTNGNHLWLEYGADDARDVGEIVDLDQLTETEMRAMVLEWLERGDMPRFIIRQRVVAVTLDDRGRRRFIDHGLREDHSLIDPYHDFKIVSAEGKIIEQY